MKYTLIKFWTNENKNEEAASAPQTSSRLIKCTPLPWATLSGASDVRHTFHLKIAPRHTQQDYRNRSWLICPWWSWGAAITHLSGLNAWIRWALFHLQHLLEFKCWMSSVWSGRQLLGLEECAEWMWWQQLLQVDKAVFWAEAQRYLCHGGICILLRFPSLPPIRGTFLTLGI